ncbi:MAG: hypothetical protein JWP57_2354 [Spirosoma sp.]|nr:hypothetical protein [Spirosoma sp.]
MKKQMMMGLAVMALLTACNKDSVQPADQTTVASARGSAVDGFGKGTVITQDQLPQAVRDYLNKTYAGFTFVQGVQGTDRAGATFYAVVIEQGGVRYHLHFDASGALLAGRGGKGGPGPNEANETTITQDKLPAKVLDYLMATYAGYTFGMAEQAADAAGVVVYYEVSITQNGKQIHLNFDATGNLLERKGGGPGGHGPKGAGTAITQENLPQSVRDYLTATYAGYTFGRAEQVTTRDGVTIYAVKITQNGADYFLLFDKDGKLISVRTKK